MISFFLSAGLFLLVITFLVFIHELGHYWPGRYLGVTIESFSIGFGRELWGRTDRYGTRWKISLIPFGGYVKFAGDADAASNPDDAAIARFQETDPQKCLHLRKPLERIFVYVGGPLANYVGAFVIFWGIFSFVGMPSMAPSVGQFSSTSVAHKAGMAVGDKIVSIDDKPVKTFDDLVHIMKHHQSKDLRVVVERQTDGQSRQVGLIMRSDDEAKPFVRFLGIMPSGQVIYGESTGPLGGVMDSLSFLGATTWKNLAHIGEMIIGKRSTDGLAGPLGIAGMVNKVRDNGLVEFLVFVGMISIGLGFFNLLPIPMLDGGHILFAFIEMLRGGKPLSPKVQERFLWIGVLFLGLVFLVTTKNDISRLDIVGSVTRLLGVS